MTKPTWHGSLPWSVVKTLYRIGRRELFSSPEPTHRPSVVADVDDVDELRRALGDSSYAPNWEVSYHKRGEIANLARVEFVDGEDYRDADGDRIVWWQTHVRAWPHDDGLLLRAHWEPEPTEHPRAHLRGVGHSLERGMSILRSDLDFAGVSYQ